MASGETLTGFIPMAAVPFPSASPAPAIRRDRSGHIVLRFADSVTNRAIFEDFLARHYDGGGITVTLKWAALTATTGNVRWSVAFERMVAHDIDADDFATAKAATTAAPAGGAGIPVDTVIAFTNAEIDGLVAGEAFRLLVERLGADGADTMTGFADLLGIELRET